MPTLSAHSERHLVERIGWLRAAVLGANDGIVSTASLLVGVAAAGTGRGEVLLAGAAGLAAGAMSMAAGEYVSVSSQADTEAADLSRERRELAASPAAEKRGSFHQSTRRVALIKQQPTRWRRSFWPKMPSAHTLGMNSASPISQLRAPYRQQ